VVFSFFREVARYLAEIADRNHQNSGRPMREELPAHPRKRARALLQVDQFLGPPKLPRALSCCHHTLTEQ